MKVITASPLLLLSLNHVGCVYQWNHWICKRSYFGDQFQTEDDFSLRDVIDLKRLFRLLLKDSRNLSRAGGIGEFSRRRRDDSARSRSREEPSLNVKGRRPKGPTCLSLTSLTHGESLERPDGLSRDFCFDSRGRGENVSPPASPASRRHLH